MKKDPIDFETIEKYTEIQNDNTATYDTISKFLLFLAVIVFILCLNRILMFLIHFCI